MEIEDRIFELSDEIVVGPELAEAIAREYEIDFHMAWTLVRKVRRERSTPYRVRTKEAIDRFSRISFY